MKREPSLLTKAAALVQIGALLLSSPLCAQEVRVSAPKVDPGQGGSVGAGLGAGIQGGSGAGFSLRAPLLNGSGVLPDLASPEVSIQAAGPSRIAAAVPNALALPKAVAGSRVLSGGIKTAPGAGPEAKEQAVSPLKSLIKHGAKAAGISQIEDAGGAKGAAESNFLKAAALGDTAQGRTTAPSVLPSVGRFFRNLLRRGVKNQAAELEPPPPIEQAPPAHQNFRELTLDNGMRVQLVRNPDLFTATVAVGYDVGGRDDPKGRSGYAHFVEHLMFQGTKRIKNWFRMIGAMGSNTNAWTYPDHTLYVHTVPMNLVQLAVSLEAERMANLEITPEKVEREKRTILEEKAGSQNAPYEAGWDKLFEGMFSNPANHRDVLGSEESIRGATAESLKEYFESHYTPDKAKVVISGNIDLDQTEAWVRQLMGAVPERSGKAPARDLSEPKQKHGTSAELTDPYAAQDAVLFGWRAPEYGSEDYYASGVLAELLQERLHQKLVFQQQKAVGVSMNLPYLERDPGAMTGSIVYGPQMTGEEALAALQAEIDAVSRGEFTDEELRRQAAKVVQSLDNQLGDSYSSTMLLTQAAVRGLSGARLEEDIRRWANVAPKDIRRAAKRFTAKTRSSVTVKPDPNQRKEAKPFEHKHEVAVDEKPTPEESGILRSLGDVDWFNVDFQAPEEFKLPNGLKVVVMPDNRRSTVYAKLAFRLGATASDPEAREKVPFVANLLRLRTERYDELDMEGLLGRIGGWIQADQKWDHVVFDGNAPAEQAADLLAILNEMVAHPHDWTDEDLARWKEWWKQGLKANALDPNVASHQRAVQDLLGDHPSARAALTPEAVDALTAGELKRLAKTHFAPDNAVLVVAGDISPEWLQKNLPGMFKDWKPSKAKPGKSPKVKIADQQGVSLIDRPGSGQALLRLSAIGEGAGSQSSKDYFPLQVASQVMGGGWASKLFRVARQAMGLAYNTFSQVVTDPAVAMWTFGMFTRQEKVQPALKALMDQSAEMREKAPEELYLTSAKNSLVGSFLMSLDYIGSIADHILGLELLGEPLKEWGAYPQKVSEVTGEAVRKVSERLLAPDKLSVTVVGDAEKLEKGLSGQGPVRVFDSEGKPKTP